MQRLVKLNELYHNTEHHKVLYSRGKNDECYTPDYGVEPILKYIPEGKIVWCPFDKEDSEFVKQIREPIVYSHIDNGQDFFEYEPDEWDIIISNPPYTNKRKYFERAISFNKPFALIMAITWLNDMAPKRLFAGKDLQLLMFDKRMWFIMASGVRNCHPTFSSAYFCWNFLPKQLIIEELIREKFNTLEKMFE